MEWLNIEREAEKRFFRKLDLHIIPMVMLLYLCVGRSFAKLSWRSGI